MKKTKQNIDWHQLDNNANLFPVAKSRSISHVFRISLKMFDAIDENLLEIALNRILPHFPAFKVRLKHGFFWSYLETNTNTAFVSEESDFPCRHIDPYENNLFLFKLTYFKNKINLEVFHVLTDGSGAISFLNAIIYEYIKLKYPNDFSEAEKAVESGIEHSRNIEDAYKKHYKESEKESYDSSKAYRLKGTKLGLGAVSAIHSYIPIKELKEVCTRYNCSYTQYFCSCILYSLYISVLDEKSSKKPVSVFVPVNLRNLFKSNTTLNFISGINLTLKFENEDNFEKILDEVKNQFDKKLTVEAMQKKLSYTVSSGNFILARIAPLPIKNFVIRLVYNMNRQSNSVTFTNMGMTKVDERFEKYIDSYQVLLNASDKEVFKTTGIAFRDYFCLSFASVLESSKLQKTIIKKMTMDGINIKIESNGVYDN